MRMYGSLAPLLARRRHRGLPALDENPPRIMRGASRARARAEANRGVVADAAGADCLTPDGRRGRVVEMLDGGHPVLVCQAV